MYSRIDWLFSNGREDYKGLYRSIKRSQNTQFSSENITFLKFHAYC